MKKPILTISMLLGAFALGAAAQPAPMHGKVMRVIDGDTVVMQDSHGTRHTLRLAGIDAPEKRMPYGQASRHQLNAMVGGEYVTAMPSKQDRYGRTVATVTHNGQDVNLTMVQSGMAWHYRKYAREQTEAQASAYAVAEQSARNRSQGLWKDPNPTSPWDWRHSGHKANKR